ncbi:TAXI family TRAP transporter solute-binding subunit [Acuticoccus mangrovi]|uniref:TAXI family TRAP transporter solute-binding subunit n=1 Tax=Acuticoccus mangrovi TaxID=2796142 RepID=A0A934MIB8_9HYPH|nr:TAXI family TRAP transporter solute-binding subunit [Acuticoccus mangrovi]MBJ3777026.1 TAXI family TRAP transporter solute-binding subunit [Acuticoccus mangrovi]
MRKFNRLIAAIGAGALLAAGAATGASAENYTLCGASPGGLWALLGAGIDAAVKAEDPSSSVTYQTSSGGFANIVQMSQGNCDMAIIHLGEGVIATNGEPPFPQPMDDFALVAVMYNWAPMQWLMSEKFAAEHDITSIADMKDTPVDLIVNRKGILPSILAEAALGQLGITYDGIDAAGGSVQFQGSKTAEELMKDGRGDIWTNAMFIGTGSINAIAESVDLRLLSVPDEVVDYMVKNYGSMPYTVPAGSYPWLKEDVKTFGAQAGLVVPKSASKEEVEALTKALLDNISAIQNVHKSMKALTPEIMMSGESLPYHEGALAAYGK